MTSTGDRMTKINTKALFRAATAAYKLDDYKAANQASIGSAGQYPTTMLLQLSARRSGSACVSKHMANTISTRFVRAPTVRADVHVASFLLKTEVLPVFGKGMGLFATHDVKAGDMVFCEKAFAATTSQDKETKSTHLVTMSNSRLALCGKYDDALWKNVVDKAVRSQSTTRQLKTLAETAHMAYKAPSVSADDDFFPCSNSYYEIRMASKTVQLKLRT